MRRPVVPVRTRARYSASRRRTIERAGARFMGTPPTTTWGEGRRRRRRNATLSSDRARLDGALDLLPLGVGQLQTRGGDIFLEVRDRRGAGNREHHGRTMQQPRERELPDRGA